MHSPAPLVLALAALALAGCAAEAPVAAAADGAAHAHFSSAQSPAVQRDLAALRRATAPFHRFDRAVEAGYAAAITPCWEHRSDGAMGYHYGKEALIDGTVSLLEPELLMYEPQPGGHLRLVGMEYIVPIDAWTGTRRRRCWGRRSTRTPRSPSTSSTSGCGATTRAAPSPTGTLTSRAPTRP